MKDNWKKYKTAAALMCLCEPYFKMHTNSIPVLAIYSQVRGQDYPLFKLAGEHFNGLSLELMEAVRQIERKLKSSSSLPEFAGLLLTSSLSEEETELSEMLVECMDVFDHLPPSQPAPVQEDLKKPADPVISQVQQTQPPAATAPVAQQVAAVAPDHWLVSGFFTDNNGNTVNLTGEGIRDLSAEAVVAAIVFTAFNAMNKGLVETAVTVLEQLPGQVGTMLKVVTAQAEAVSKEDSAKKLTEEWTSTLENADVLFPADSSNKMPHLVLSSIKSMASVKAGLYPPLSTLVQVLGRDLAPAVTAKRASKPVKK